MIKPEMEPISTAHEYERIAMITGRQIREARKLLKLSTSRLSSLADLPVEIIDRAEKVDGTPAITLAQGRKLEAALNARGVVFAWNGSVTVAPSTKQPRS